jgi:hypothetical protein
VRISRQLNSVPLQLSGRHDIPSGCPTIQASSVRTTRTFCLNLPLCREALYCSSLHLSGHLSSTFGRHSVFDQLCDFFSKHRYGKTVATVWTKCVPFQMRSFIRQVVHSKSIRSIGIKAGTLRLKDLIPYCDPYLFVTSIFLLHLLSWISLSYLKKIMILSFLKFLLNWIKWFLQKS